MKFWRDRNGKRIYTSERARVARLFRYHVNTKSNPRGRIFRMLCQFCKPNTQITLSQFHHVNYAHPFVGVWVCESCHRKIELKTVKITAHKLCDYTGLVQPLLRPATSAAMRAFSEERSKNTG